MITVPLIHWQPIATMPEDRKDGRQMLLWSLGHAVAACWSERHLFWDTGFASEIDGDELEAFSPTHWADINPPE